MRKVIVNARFLTQEITGVQRFAIELSKVLKAKYGGEFEFVAPKDVLDDELAKKLEVKIIGENTGQFWEQYDLVKYLKGKKKKPILLSLGSTSPLFYKNKITTLHDIAFVRNPSWFSKKFVLWYKFLIPKLLRTSQKIITVSEFSKKEIQEHYKIPDEKVKVIYNAISGDFRKQKTQETGGMPYMLTVMSLSPRKNVENILHAFSTVTKKHKDIKLYMVGGYSFDSFPKNNISKILAENPNVELKGYVSDEVLHLLYQNALCFVYPSLYEGFGIPPLEAAAMGCPSIVSDVTAMPEVCRDGVIYCNPHDSSSIVQAMELLIGDKDLRTMLVEKAKKNNQRFSWEISADKIVKIVESLEQGKEAHV